jgi:hypothetical protein
MIQDFKTFESSSVSPLNSYALDAVFGNRWSLNPETGLVDVRGDFSIPQELISPNEISKEIKIGTVTGSVHLGGKNLAMIPNLIPKRVEGDFRIGNNKLRDLEGCPEYIGGDLVAEHNYLESLKGSPKYVGGNFDVSYNTHLKDLVGGPEYVGYDFEAYGCMYLTLKGAPEYIGANFWMDLNKKRFSIGDWNLEGWLELLEESRPFETHKILPLFTKERMEKDIQQSPENFIVTLAKYKELFDFSKLLPYNLEDLIPEKYREEFHTLGDLGRLGF